MEKFVTCAMVTTIQEDAQKKKPVAKSIHCVKSYNQFNYLIDVNHSTLCKLYPAYHKKLNLVAYAG